MKVLVIGGSGLFGRETLAAFKKDFPDRFIDVSVAEQNCAGIAADLALEGNIPFIS